MLTSRYHRLYFFVENQMEIQVINEIRDELKVFRSVEEFNLYYQKNKEAMEKLTTQHLNKIYKIELPDSTVYRITKKNCGVGKGKTLSGDIYLKKVQSNTVERPLWEIALESVKADVAGMKIKIEKISETVNILAKVVNAIQGYDS